MARQLPILDPPPTGKPQDWSLREMKSLMAMVSPRRFEWHSPYVKNTADRDQDKGGTCTGMAYARAADLNYLRLTKDFPTAEDKAQFQKDFVDAIGTRCDILFPKSFSAEAAYQMGRHVGNITYPSGGEIRFNARAWRDIGQFLESQWHTDKERTCVWTYPPGVRPQANGGITQEQVEQFAALHKIKGWAMVGRSDGYATWDEICDAVWEYGFVICAIPIYENFTLMEGGDGTYPVPRGNIAGYHAQVVTGYSSDVLDIEHSWGTWCGQHGKLPKEYYEVAQDQCVWMVIFDDEEALIAGATIYKSITVSCNVPAQVSVDDVVIGTTPQKFAIEKGRTYLISVSADGYTAQSRTVDDSSQPNQVFELEPSPQPIRSWRQILIEFLKALFERN